MLLTHKIHWQYGCYEGWCTHSMDIAGPASDEPLEWYIDTQVFWVMEGNFACDCNRTIFMVKLPFLDKNQHLPCGDDVIFHRIEFYFDGELVAVDSESVGPYYVPA